MTTDKKIYYVAIVKKYWGKITKIHYFEEVRIELDCYMILHLNKRSRYFVIDGQSGEAKLVDTSQTSQRSWAWYETRVISTDVMTIIDVAMKERWPPPLIDWLIKTV